MLNLFSNEKINTERQVELDIAKGLSIIFMIIVHCIISADYFDYSASHMYNLIFYYILGQPFAAPVFMFCMGVGIVYSRHSDSDSMIKRGVTLLILGIFVNIIKTMYPFLFSQIMNVNLMPDIGWLFVFYVDILMFAGLFFCIYGMLKKLNFTNNKFLILSIILSLLGTFLRFTNLENTILNLLFGYFIGTNIEFTAFPFFNWFIIPVAGSIWGHYFIRCKDKNRFFKFWPVFIIISLAYFIYSTQIPGGFLGELDSYYYFMTIIDVIFCLIYIHGNIGFCYYLYKILPDVLVKIFSVLSSNITTIYILQWFYIPLIMGLCYYLIDNLVYNEVSVSLIAIFILIISTLSSLIVRKIKMHI